MNLTEMIAEARKWLLWEGEEIAERHIRSYTSERPEHWSRMLAPSQVEYVWEMALSAGPYVWEEATR